MMRRSFGRVATLLDLAEDKAKRERGQRQTEKVDADVVGTSRQEQADDCKHRNQTARYPP